MEDIFSLLGKKGVIDIIFKIKEGVNTFTTLKKSLDEEGKGVSTRTLAERLDELEHENIIQKESNKYILTKKGEELIEIIEKVKSWEAKWREVKIPRVILGMLGEKR
ncbi:winged helix-turn-helix transcriptional regulator [Methanotorris igneus]|uniref:Transcriptional regulator, HxlR family n=1 Tax=Methanotorris igneus (strain DSM 5666 / JCM 11834 / Kol 5) TaxID=880724 RepID=F6BDZ0_METIK|nr:helix-turn-helix domain-containing protein [Methanotorris igneus]AEF96701.1 transcriptional regulator, HxlR family [Methanotorris igneus Kol 5]